MRAFRSKPLRLKQRKSGESLRNLFRPVRLRKRAVDPGIKRIFSRGMFAAGAFISAYGLIQCYRTPFWTYPNYWGGAVFAPMVIVIGVLMMVLSPFTITVVSDEPEKRGRFPHEDVEQPWSPTDR